MTTGLYDWLKATGEEIGTIEGVSFVWSHAADVSVGACYAPIVLNAAQLMLMRVFQDLQGHGNSIHHRDTTRYPEPKERQAGYKHAT